MLRQEDTMSIEELHQQGMNHTIIAAMPSWGSVAKPSVGISRAEKRNRSMVQDRPALPNWILSAITCRSGFKSTPSSLPSACGRKSANAATTALSPC
jgi:hypothetical protein